MSYQGPYNGSDSEAEDFWLNNPSLANLAGAPSTSVDWWLGENCAQAVAPEVHSEGVCNCSPIPAELSKESCCVGCPIPTPISNERFTNESRWCPSFR